MSFRFRLQKVLDFRQRIVDQKSREVGEAGRVVNLIQVEIDQVHTQVTSQLENESALLAVADIRFMGHRRSWLDHLESRIDSLTVKLNSAAEELEHKRSLLTAAWRDLEVLQKLKQRQKEAWLSDQLRLENQELDEIGQIRSDRQQREKLTRNQEQLALKAR